MASKTYTTITPTTTGDLVLKTTPRMVEIVGTPPERILLSLTMLSAFDPDLAYFAGPDTLVIKATEPHWISYQITGWDSDARCLIAVLVG